MSNNEVGIQSRFPISRDRKPNGVTILVFEAEAPGRLAGDFVRRGGGGFRCNDAAFDVGVAFAEILESSGFTLEGVRGI
jgi:hypothetical protein